MQLPPSPGLFPVTARRAVCAVLLGYCAYQESERTQRIQACEAAGGWFCSWRY